MSAGAPLYSEMNLGLLILSEPQKGKSSGGPSSMQIYVNTTNGKPFEFQVTGDRKEDRSRVVFEPTPPSGNNSRVNLALTVNPDDEALLKFWADYDTICIKHVAKHSLKFLKKEMTEDEVRAIWTPCLRAKPGYSPYLKARFDTSPDPKVPFSCYEANEAQRRFAAMHYSRLQRNDEVVAVVRPGMLYYFQGKVGSTVDITNLVRFAAPPVSSFPFRISGMGGDDFTEVGMDELFSEANIAAMDAVAAKYMEEKKEAAPQSLEPDAEDDGSTVTIDPVTMQPVSKKRSKGEEPEAEEAEEAEAATKSSKRRKRG